jgi:hypothetical protein
MLMQTLLTAAFSGLALGVALAADLRRFRVMSSARR